MTSKVAADRLPAVVIDFGSHTTRAGLALPSSSSSSSSTADEKRNSKTTSSSCAPPSHIDATTISRPSRRPTIATTTLPAGGPAAAIAQRDANERAYKAASFTGYDANKLASQQYTTKWPVENGIVTNWDDWEYLMEDLYHNRLKVDPTTQPVRNHLANAHNFANQSTINGDVLDSCCYLK